MQKNNVINVKLHGCWHNIETISNGETFHSFKSTQKDHKIILTVFKKIFNDNERGGDESVDYFGLKSEYNITNDFEVGEVEFMVKNPDREELTCTIAVE